MRVTLSTPECLPANHPPSLPPQTVRLPRPLSPAVQHRTILHQDPVYPSSRPQRLGSDHCQAHRLLLRLESATSSGLVRDGADELAIRVCVDRRGRERKGADANRCQGVGENVSRELRAIGRSGAGGVGHRRAQDFAECLHRVVSLRDVSHTPPTILTTRSCRCQGTPVVIPYFYPDAPNEPWRLFAQ